jgi:MoaA/NifB/PqqE/SkfB family radical SAM enzyme
MSSSPGVQPPSILWLEVTNGCNLVCGHCYSDSGPGTSRRDTLLPEHYRKAIAEAANLGFERVQFIGGEPLLYKPLPDLLRHCTQYAFRALELYTNLTFLPGPVLDALVDVHGVSVATSVYSHHADVHDTITGVDGSWRATIANIERLISRGVAVGATCVEMEQNAGHYDDLRAFLLARGVSSIGHDRVRRVGRAAQLTPVELTELCGACAGMTACLSFDGFVYPCIMARSLPLGSILERSLADILASEGARTIRKRIAQACVPAVPDCGPQAACNPIYCGPQGNCGPDRSAIVPWSPRARTLPTV